MLNIGWIILNWREVVPLILGIVFFPFIIAGVILNTIFLVREVRRNEQQDSFLNAITHELKTPSPRSGSISKLCNAGPWTTRSGRSSTR